MSYIRVTRIHGGAMDLQVFDHDCMHIGNVYKLLNDRWRLVVMSEKEGRIKSDHDTQSDALIYMQKIWINHCRETRHRNELYTTAQRSS